MQLADFGQQPEHLLLSDLAESSQFPQLELLVMHDSLRGLLLPAYQRLSPETLPLPSHLLPACRTVPPWRLWCSNPCAGTDAAWHWWPATEAALLRLGLQQVASCLPTVQYLLLGLPMACSASTLPAWPTLESLSGLSTLKALTLEARESSWGEAEMLQALSRVCLHNTGLRSLHVIPGNMQSSTDWTRRQRWLHTCFF